MDNVPDREVQGVGASDDHALIRDLLQSDVWEERLRVARLKREEVLSGKLKAAQAAPDAPVKDSGRLRAAHQALGRRVKSKVPVIPPAPAISKPGPPTATGPYWVSKGLDPVRVPTGPGFAPSRVAPSPQRRTTPRLRAMPVIVGVVSGLIVGVTAATTILQAVAERTEVAFDSATPATKAVPAIRSNLSRPDAVVWSKSPAQDQGRGEFVAVGPLSDAPATEPAATLPVALLQPTSAPNPLRPPVTMEDTDWASPSNGASPSVLAGITGLTPPVPDATVAEPSATLLRLMSLDSPSLPRTVEPDTPPYADVQLAAAPVLVRLTVPDSLSADVVAGAVALIEGQGARLGGTVSSRFTAMTSNVRFFHPGDAAAATRIAATIGGTARDFSGFLPSPPDGTIEVVLADKG